MIPAQWKKNDKKAKQLIIVFSVIVFIVVSILGKYNLAGKVNLSFDIHIFAKLNAIINSIVSVLLIAGLLTVKNKKYLLHKKIMIAAMMLSVLFLLSYICHHLFAGEALYGDVNHDNMVDAFEKTNAGSIRTIYLIILITHIPLAGLALPFILFAAYRALTGEYDKHKKLVRYVWPVWFYVAVTGVVVYLMISPYYR